MARKDRPERKYPIGAEILAGQGVHFRLWAPDHDHVDLVLVEQKGAPLYLPMQAEKKRPGYFSLHTQQAHEGSFYHFRLSHQPQFYSDPASRYQPFGPNGPSCVMSSYHPWEDGHWPGVNAQGHVIYEMHIGTFTEPGTFVAAAKHLPRLADLGITLIEIMPLNDFPGHFGWGYDGVNLFAPFHLYGPPKELKNFINLAHQLSLGVVLDVVYNHLGPESNQLPHFAQAYFSAQNQTDWGPTINFDHPQVSEFFLTNARYWIEEFHFDGLRIDATSTMYSSTAVHILQKLTEEVKAAAANRQTLVIGENEPQNTNLLRPYSEGGFGFDMLWNDDFHHSALVRLTGKREAYYTDYLGTPQEFISSVKYGFLYQGQYYEWQKKPRGTPNLHLAPQSLVIFLENHDQLANSGHGKRLHQRCDPGIYKAMCALLFLSPNTPLIFQGQEFNSSQPFYYFADHAPDLSPLIRQGRRKELAQFPHLGTAEARHILTDPDNPTTFTKSKLDHHEMESNSAIYALFRDLIHLRRHDPVFKIMQQIKIDGAVLSNDAFLLRYFGENLGDRVLLINFGCDLYFAPAPEPLLVAGLDKEFEIMWSSEGVIYGGAGTPPINIPSWKLLGHSAIVLKTIPGSKKETQ